MKNKYLMHRLAGIMSLGLATLFTSACIAEDFNINAMANASDLMEVVEITRTADELAMMILPNPRHDRDFINTALIFNNPEQKAANVLPVQKYAKVQCVGYDANGNPVGKIELKIPVNGIRWATVSDLSNGADFIGSVVCKSSSRVIPTAFMATRVGMSDVKAFVDRGWGRTVIRFPMVISQ